MAKRYANGKFYLHPKDLPKATFTTDAEGRVTGGGNIYQASCLSYLIQCENGTGTAFPSYKAITQGIMSRPQAIKAVKALIEKGLVSITRRGFKTNIYRINHNTIEDAIEQYTTATSKPQRLVNHSNALVNHNYHPRNVTSKPQRPGTINNHLTIIKDDPDKYIKGSLGHMVQRGSTK